MNKNSTGSTTASSSSDRALTPIEHQARAIFLGLVYDSLTHMYRPLSPGGHKYKYTDCLFADTLEPVPKGAAREIEEEKRKGNVVSGNRTPGYKKPVPVASGRWGYR